MSQPAVTRPRGITESSLASTAVRALSASTAPTVSDVREGLRATLQNDYERVWSEVCSRSHVATDAASLPETELDGLLTHLAAQDDLCRVLALSWRIRATAARKLNQLGR